MVHSHKYLDVLIITPDANPHGTHLWVNMAATQPDQPDHRLEPLPDALLEILPRVFYRLSPHGNVIFSIQPVSLRKLQRFISQRVFDRFSTVEDILRFSRDN